MASRIKVSPQNRRYFEARGIDDVKLMVLLNIYSPEKMVQARTWIGEQEHGRADWRANIALVISCLSLLLAAAALFLKL
jgi:hypothetical protein